MEEYLSDPYPKDPIEYLQSEAGPEELNKKIGTEQCYNSEPNRDYIAGVKLTTSAFIHLNSSGLVLEYLNQVQNVSDEAAIASSAPIALLSGAAIADTYIEEMK